MTHRPRLRRLGLPAAAARHPDDRDGARRRRGDVRRAGRAPVPAGVRRRRRRRPRRLGGAVGARRRAGWRSPPTRYVVQADVLPRRRRSATWPSTAPSTTWRCPGRTPLYLSTAFILEEGTALADIGRVATALGQGRARSPASSWSPATPRWSTAGSGDGVYVNTAGIGRGRRRASTSGRGRARPGDAVIVSGDIGVHGVAVMSCREGLEFGTDGRERHRPAARAGRRDARHRRRRARAARPDPRRASRPRSTRSPRAAGVGIELVERDLPVPAEVARRLRAARAGPAAGRQRGQAARDRARATAPRRCWPRCGRTRCGAGRRGIGACVAEHPRMVVARTGLGGTRVVDLPIGEQLPRIC